MCVSVCINVYKYMPRCKIKKRALDAPTQKWLSKSTQNASCFPVLFGFFKNHFLWCFLALSICPTECVVYVQFLFLAPPLLFYTLSVSPPIHFFIIVKIFFPAPVHEYQIVAIRWVYRIHKTGSWSTGCSGVVCFFLKVSRTASKYVC